MSGYQKALKVIAIITIVFSSLIIALGILFIIAGGIVGANFDNPEVNASLGSTLSPLAPGISDPEAAAVTAGFGILGGIFVIIDGVISLIVGILGVRGANNPAKIGPFRVFAILGFIISLIYIVILCFGAGAWENWIAAGVDVVITGLCLWLAVKIRAQAAPY